jgi:autotransporter passenger strand-loop-strand repeat protein
MPTYTSKSPNGDVILAQTMPEAEYMYGCTPTAVAMVLGYYDLYGYRGADLSNMIEGDVDSKSRGTDGNKYNMNAFDTALGRATATESFVSRFHSRSGKETTPSQELKFAFKSDKKTVNTDKWDCIADYIGTGQFWRGNDNLSTSVTYGTLEDIYKDDRTFEIESGSTTRTVRCIDTTMLYGLDLYVQSRGYAMDYEITGTYVVDTAGGSFTFEDYMKEIDEGRPVMISIRGHSMTGYGYNAETKEIIFDDCYESGRRMKWGGTYRFDSVDRSLMAITVIGINVNGSVDPAFEPVAGSAWEKLILTTAPDSGEGVDYVFSGTELYLNCTVSNRGTKASGSFSLSLRIDGELVRTETVDSINGGASCNMQGIPLGELTVGLHNVQVILDEDNVLQELSASNNKEKKNFLVLKPGTGIIDTTRKVTQETVSDVYVRGGADLFLEDGKVYGAFVRGTITESSADGTFWTSAQFVVSRGGYASGTNVCDYGRLTVSSGGTAVDTRIFTRGSAFVQIGGTLRDITLESGGKITMASGGKLTGQLRFESGASVWGSNGSIVDFDLSALAPGARVCATGLSAVGGVPLYTLTVSGTQEHGTYRLADGVESFTKNVTVMDTGGTKLGTLAVGKTAEINGSDYKLVLSGDVLSLTVSDHVHVDTVVPTVSNVRADITEPTWRSVTVKADFSDDEDLASSLYRIGGNGTWTEYEEEGVTVPENTTVFFKAIDATGNESEIAEYAVSNITSSGCIIPAGQSAVVSSGRIYTGTVLSGGSMIVSSGGAANGTAVQEGGLLEVCSDGTADGVTVGENGKIVVDAGGKVSGQICFAPGADVSFAPLSVLSFDISGLAPGAPAPANGISRIQGTPGYTLTASGTQKKGLYVLADDAGEFNEEVAIAIQTASVLLSGTLEIGCTADIGAAGYSLNRSDNTLTLTVGAAGVANSADCGWNNWLYIKKTKAVNSKVKDPDPAALNPGTTRIRLDSENSVSDGDRQNFVGFCDSADFAKIKLDSAAKLSFLVDATGSAKFIIYQLVEGKDKYGNPTYKLKTVQTTTLTKKKSFTATTRALLLEKGDYFICMQSTAKKNGCAYYDVTLVTQGDKASYFYSDGDGGGNNVLYDKKTKLPNSFVRDSAGIDLALGDIRVDAEKPSSEEGAGWNNFVGFGDAADYAKINLSGTAKVSFSLEATNAAKFVICRIITGTDRNGNPTYKLKTVQTTTLKKKKGKTTYTATTKAITLTAAENYEYYICMQSTTAKKGKCAYYNVTLGLYDGPDVAVLKGAAEPAPVQTADPSPVPVTSTDTVLAAAPADPGYATLSGDDLAGLQMPGTCDPAASPLPADPSGDLFAGLADPVETFSDVSASAGSTQIEGRQLSPDSLFLA